MVLLSVSGYIYSSPRSESKVLSVVRNERFRPRRSSSLFDAFHRLAFASSKRWCVTDCESISPKLALSAVISVVSKISDCCPETPAMPDGKRVSISSQMNVIKRELRGERPEAPKGCRCKQGREGVYHENVINAGFSTIGSSKWLTVTVAMGRMGTKSLICQSGGINEPVARMIIPTIPVSENAMLYLNFFRTLGTSMKKLENSASLAVAPQVMSTSNMCARRAPETWRERPPRKMQSIKVHLKFMRTIEVN